MDLQDKTKEDLISELLELHKSFDALREQYDKDKNIIGTFGIARDITERKQTEEAFRKLSLRQEVILTAVPDIIMEVDNNKIYTWANHAGLEFFGKDVIGKKASFYFEGEQETFDAVKPLFEGIEEL